jgi:hypothetical protein
VLLHHSGSSAATLSPSSTRRSSICPRRADQHVALPWETDCRCKKLTPKGRSRVPCPMTCFFNDALADGLARIVDAMKGLPGAGSPSGVMCTTLPRSVSAPCPRGGDLERSPMITNKLPSRPIPMRPSWFEDRALAGSAGFARNGKRMAVQASRRPQYCYRAL